MRRASLFILVLACIAPAQEPEAAPEEHASTPDFEKAVKLQRRKKWVAAKRAFERFLKKYPDSPHARSAADRCGDNAYLGTMQLWRGGPSERRIDVAVMGDGFTIEGSDQSKQEKWAKLCIDVLWNEKGFGEYRNYFNVWFVRLASLEEGVDPSLSPEEIKKIQERNRRRRRKKKIDFNTALDAKAAGPQGQVMCNRGLVYKWLEIANEDMPGCGDNRFVIAFAQFGRLGMGGGGVANVGRPDKSVTTHEFGHAFSRLLDEYQGNPNPPGGFGLLRIRAANASTTDDPKKVPWAHMLKKKVKGVGIYEGGATHNKGVWRPARSCAMNAAGNTSFCPVCREQSILVIYEYVNPIDEVDPPTEREVRVTEGDRAAMLSVLPMQPRKKRLQATWYVETLDPKDEPETDPITPIEGVDYPEQAGGRRPNPMFMFVGERSLENREEYAEPPAGEPSRLGKKLKGNPVRHGFAIGKLVPGYYRVTVEVEDRTKWVIKDEKYLLKERASWRVRVAKKPDASR